MRGGAITLDSYVNLEEFLLLHFLFTVFDTDNSGYISQNELYTWMEFLSTGMKKPQWKLSKEDVTNIFRDILEGDYNTEEELDNADFDSFMQKQVREKGMDLKEVVKYIKEDKRNNT